MVVCYRATELWRCWRIQDPLGALLGGVGASRLHWTTRISIMNLAYDGEDFPARARKAIFAGEVFSFEIHGSAWEKLRDHVVGDEVPRWAALSAIPELIGFVAVMALTSVAKRRVRVVSFPGHAEVHVDGDG